MKEAIDLIDQLDNLESRYFVSGDREGAIRMRTVSQLVTDTLSECQDGDGLKKIALLSQCYQLVAYLL